MIPLTSHYRVEIRLDMALFPVYALEDSIQSVGLSRNSVNNVIN